MGGIEKDSVTLVNETKSPACWYRYAFESQSSTYFRMKYLDAGLASVPVSTLSK